MSAFDSSSLGDQGESYFHGCLGKYSEFYRATINAPQKDRNGWDFLVEVQERAESPLPIDLQPGKLDFFVQVKATTKKEKTIRISLSNALIAIKSSLPHFIVLAHYVHGLESDPNIYLKHVAAREAKVWLKIARQTDKNKIRTKTVLVKFLDEELTFGHPLDKICAIVKEHGGDAYAERKIARSKEIGYEDGHNFAQLDFDVTEVEFARHLVGLTKSVPLKKFEIFDNRFNIPSAFPIRFGTSGEVTLHGFRKPVTAIFRTQGGETINCPGTAWVTPPNLTSSALARLVAGPISIILNLTDQTSECTIERNGFQIKTLDEHRVLTWLQLWGGTEFISAQADLSGQRLSFGSFGNIRTNIDEAGRLHLITTLIAKIAKREARDKITISLDELILEINRNHGALLMLTNLTRVGSRVKIKIDKRRKDVLVFMAVSLGEISIGGIFRKRNISDYYKRKDHYLYHGPAEIVSTASIIGSSEELRIALKHEFTQFRRNSTEEFLSFEEGDLAIMTEKVRVGDDFIITHYTPD